MAGITRRITDLFTIKANRAPDRAEDPRELLGHACERDLDEAPDLGQGR